MRQANHLKELDLLVNTGLGVAPIAPSLSALLCKIVGAEAGGLSWFSEAGKPEGFYQRGSTRQAELLFMNRYEELFAGPCEYTPFWALRNQGRGIIHPGHATQAYLRSNTFNMLIKPSHCRYLLSVLVDWAGVPRLAGCFFRAAANPFTETDAKNLAAMIPVLRSAVGKRANALSLSHAKATGGYMLVSSDGGQVEMTDSQAEQLLNSIKLFDQNISFNSSQAPPPRFVQQLCEQLRRQGIASCTTTIALAGGMLTATANRMSAVQDVPLLMPHDTLNSMIQPSAKILVSLQFRQTNAIEVVRSISLMGLSPTQSRIAMYAAGGGSRSDCAAHHRLSKEALKKHLREIYAASRSTDWQELTATLQAVAS